MLAAEVVPFYEVDLAEGIRLIRERLHMSNAQIAAHCEVSLPTISNWSKSATRPTKLKSVRRLRELACRAKIQIRGLQ